MIRAVIFDFGGVLVRTEDQAPRQRLAEQLGRPLPELYKLVFDCDAAVQATLGRVPERAVWDHLAASLNLDAAALAACQQAWWAGDRLDPDLVALIRDLRPRYKVAILSNAWSGARQGFTEIYGLDREVDDIIISAEVGLAKPGPEIFHLAARRLGVSPAEAVFVDDFAENIAGAQAVGMPAIHFKPGVDVRAELERLGVAV